MQPYHKAAEAIRSGQETPLHLLKHAGLTALGGGIASAGSKALGKLIPAVGSLINKYVPDDLLQKGLSKIDPRFGKFIQGAIDEGYSSDEIREFLGDKVEKSQEPKDHRNIIEQHSPELNSFLSEKIKAGEDPIRAAALALFENGNPFEPTIRKIEKEHKTNWSQLVQSIYGGGQGAPQQPQQEAPQPMQQPQSQGQGAQAFQAILQKINQKLGG
jgi:DNA-binding transcriptional MerR regulator